MCYDNNLSLLFQINSLRIVRVSTGWNLFSDISHNEAFNISVEELIGSMFLELVCKIWLE